MQQPFKTGCLEFQVYVYFKTLLILRTGIIYLSLSTHAGFWNHQLCEELSDRRFVTPNHVDWVRGNPLQKYTHPETNSLSLKIDPWKGDSELGNHPFLEAMLKKNWPRILFKIVRMKCNYARKFPKLYSLGGGIPPPHRAENHTLVGWIG